MNDSPRNHILKMHHTMDPNHYLEVMEKNMSEQMYYAIQDNITDDLYNQAIMLNEKVNIHWSDKRKNEVHSLWTKQLMAEEIKNFENVDYDYPKESLPQHKFLHLITNNLDLFMEGKLMNHCVYTNYKSYVENKNYFVFSYISNNTRGTLGVMHNNGKFTVNQFYGKRNSAMSEVDKTIVQNYIKRDDVQEWFSLVCNNPIAEL
jgi:hypothetical protein